MSEKTLQQAQEESGVTDLTTTLEEATACGITARAALKVVIATADKIREDELKQRVEDAANEGNTETTLAYEVLIEHKKIRATWRASQAPW